MLDAALSQIPLDTLFLVIALVISICVPFITHWLDNRHREKLTRLKSIEETVATAFKEYLHYAGLVCSDDVANAYASFLSAHYVAYLYAPDSARILMDELLPTMNKLDLGEIESLDSDSLNRLSDVAKIFSRHLSELRENKHAEPN